MAGELQRQGNALRCGVHRRRSFEGVLHDTALAKAAIRPGGVIIWHDDHDLGTFDVRAVPDEMHAYGEAIAWRHEGTIEAKRYGGSRSPLEDHAEEILAVIEEQPDLTLAETVAVMRKRKIPGSRTALFRFLARHAVTLKKSPSRCRAAAGGCSSRPPTLDTRAGLA